MDSPKPADTPETPGLDLDGADFCRRYGRWALVTGAGQGIGAMYCQRLVELGMPVLLVDVDAGLLADQQARLRALAPSVEIRTIVCDLADVAAVESVVASVDDLEIGLLVANAGIGAVGRWLEVPRETKINQVLVNCVSVVVLADLLTPKMVERRRGGVIVMASGSASGGSSFIATYAATKAFDRVFAEGLWLGLGRHGIDVTTVMPGPVDTPGFRASLPEGRGPTKLMQPVDPYVIVDAALQGLGSKINITPGSSRLGSVFGAVMSMLPRTATLKIGDRAVRQLYDH